MPLREYSCNSERMAHIRLAINALYTFVSFRSYFKGSRESCCCFNRVNVGCDGLDKLIESQSLMLVSYHCPPLSDKSALKVLFPSAVQFYERFERLYYTIKTSE